MLFVSLFLVIYEYASRSYASVSMSSHLYLCLFRSIVILFDIRLKINSLFLSSVLTHFAVNRETLASFQSLV